MALPIIKTEDRIRLVYTGDPSITKASDKPADYQWRAADPKDAQAGASVAIVHPLNKTAITQCAINARGNDEVMLYEYVRAGFLGFDGDARQLEDQIECMPNAARAQLGGAIARVSSDAKDPFGQRSCG